MAITGGNDNAFRGHVDDHGNKQPPVALLVVLVEDAVVFPDVFVIEETGDVAFCLLIPVREQVYADCKEGEDGCEYTESDAGEDFGGPRVAARELVHAVQSPDTVEQENQVRDCLGHDPPVAFAEVVQAFGEFAAEGEGLEDDFEEEDSDDDGADDDCEDEKDGHEGVCLRDRELLDVGFDAVDQMHALAVA